MDTVTKIYCRQFGANTAKAKFQKCGVNYSVQSWGLKKRDIDRHELVYQRWLTECCDDFCDVVDERLFLKTYEYPDRLRHTLEVMDPQLAREQDLNPGKTSLLYDVSKLTPTELEQLKQSVAKYRARIRSLSEAEKRALGLE